jgi:hypothetical protein
MTILSEVLSNIGFDAKIVGFGTEFEKKLSAFEVQKSFLENLHIAGYFHNHSIRSALKSLRKENINPEDNFEKVMEVLSLCGAHEKHPQKFNANILFEKFAHNGHFLSGNDVKNVMVHLGRKAFGRKDGQERNEIESHLWAEIHGEHYLKNAKKLGLIFEEKPRLKKYHETWIQGAAYHRMKQRAFYAKKLQDEGYDLGVIRLLSGERELWLEIDQLSKDEILQIAKRNNIEVIGFEEREVAGSIRTYPKYAANEMQKITEGLVAKEIYQQIFSKNSDDLIVDAKAEEGANRVTTASATSNLVKHQFATRIRNGDFGKNEINILIVSNQPYVERQTLTNERIALKELRKLELKAKIKFYGCGVESQASIIEIHSEFGALVSEKYLKQTMEDKLRMIKILKKMNLK